jgi:SOS-response transcriptional repressor LexA
MPRRELECLTFVASFVAQHGHAPLKREIADHIGLSSRTYVDRVLDRLEAKEFIQNRKYKIRGIELRSPAMAFTVDLQPNQVSA